MKEFLQFTRGSGTSKRRRLNSRCTPPLGEVSKPWWPPPPDVLSLPTPPQIQTALYNVSVTSETSVKHVHPERREPAWVSQRPSRVFLFEPGSSGGMILFIWLSLPRVPEVKCTVKSTQLIQTSGSHAAVTHVVPAEETLVAGIRALYCTQFDFNV